ncbi:hypothetical protein M885DRAFT_506937 [Pelagophyceae sp. CCMP2097]|nr:hypothetical protein M885DRAFT_506937 [Pelagophyceae sp. CCMP2097]
MAKSLLQDGRFWLFVFVLILQIRVVYSSPPTPSTLRRRAELRAAINAGRVVNTTECHARLLTYEFSLEIQPDRAPL